MVTEVIMKHQRNNGILVLTSVFLIMVLLALLLVGQACDPAVPLQIENRTDMVLTAYVEGKIIGDVEPNNSIKVKDLSATFSYILIEAKSSEGEVIYSRKFSLYELVDADWKVVIWPTVKGAENSDNVT